MKCPHRRLWADGGGSSYRVASLFRVSLIYPNPPWTCSCLWVWSRPRTWASLFRRARAGNWGPVNADQKRAHVKELVCIWRPCSEWRSQSLSASSLPRPRSRNCARDAVTCQWIERHRIKIEFLSGHGWDPGNGWGGGEGDTADASAYPSREVKKLPYGTH